MKHPLLTLAFVGLSFGAPALLPASAFAAATSFQDAGDDAGELDAAQRKQLRRDLTEAVSRYRNRAAELRQIRRIAEQTRNQGLLDRAERLQEKNRARFGRDVAALRAEYGDAAVDEALDEINRRGNDRDGRREPRVEDGDGSPPKEDEDPDVEVTLPPGPTPRPLPLPDERERDDDSGDGDGGKVTICHKTGNSGKSQTITVSRSALDAHLAHGDVIGSCEAGQGMSGKPEKDKAPKGGKPEDPGKPEGAKGKGKGNS